MIVQTVKEVDHVGQDRIMDTEEELTQNHEVMDHKMDQKKAIEVAKVVHDQTMDTVVHIHNNRVVTSTQPWDNNNHKWLKPERFT
jgi:hypothetical protein